MFVVNSFLSENRIGEEKHEGRRPFVLLFSCPLKAARIRRGRRQVRSAAGRTRASRRAPLIRAAFRGVEESDAGTLRNEVPASLSPRPPG